MEKRIIARGLLAGAVAGVLSFLFARVLVEPLIGQAIDYEDTAAHGHGMHEHGIELFTRGVQENVGMGFGVVAFGVALGALFSVAFVVAYGRIRAHGVRALSLWLAAGAFGAVALVPFLKYPPNPPSVGRPETIGDRTGLYLVMVLLSPALAVGALWLARRLTPRLGGWRGGVLAAGGYVVAIAVVMLVLPGADRVPDDLPAGVLYDFRMYSLGTQAVTWATIGLVFASLAARVLGEKSPSQRAATLAA